MQARRSGYEPVSRGACCGSSVKVVGSLRCSRQLGHGMVSTSVSGATKQAPWHSEDMSVDIVHDMHIREHIPFTNIQKALRHLCVHVQQSMPTIPPWRFSRPIGSRGALRIREIDVVDPPTRFLFPAGVMLGFPTIPAILFAVARSICIYRPEDHLGYVLDRQTASDVSQKLTALQQDRTYIGD